MVAFYFAIFPSIGGRAYETDNLFPVEEVGRTLGCIHQIKWKKSYEYRPTVFLLQNI